MPVLTLREAARLLDVSDDTVRRWAASGRFELRRTSSGHQGIASEELAALASQRAAEPPSIAAPSSARNHFPGIVTGVVRDTVMAQVELQCGPHRVVALISREAADELRLEPGSLAIATVKATNVTIDAAGVP